MCVNRKRKKKPDGCGKETVRKDVVEKMINKIILSDDKVTITFNFSDDQREFDIAEMARIIETREKIMNILDNDRKMVHSNKEELMMDNALLDEAVSEGNGFFV